MAETWRVAPDASGMWWRDWGKGNRRFDVVEVTVDDGDGDVWFRDGDYMHIGKHPAVRWARCLPPEILAPGDPTRTELATALAIVTAELDALRAQLAPLVACVDALRAAARAAGWSDADATGETLVAWVRREEREACARIADTAAEAAKVRALGIGKRALESMLATARREGAEAMRAKCLGRLEEMLDELHENGAGRDAAAQALTDAHEYMRSSLCRIDDAPGGAT